MRFLVAIIFSDKE